MRWLPRQTSAASQRIELGALADRLAGFSGATATVAVIAVAETLAEKVLSFLRRFAMRCGGQLQQKWDKALVRHIYDAHCIVSQRPDVVDEAVAAFVVLTQGDVLEFGYQHPAFAQNPKALLFAALSQAARDQQIRAEYEGVLLPLVYGAEKVPFEQAWRSFSVIANRMIAALD